MVTKQPQTKPGGLSETARHVVLPSGIVSTGWPAVRDKCAEFGVSFDDWQDGIGRIIFAKRDDGTYACSIGGVAMSIPRQVGKTFLIGAAMFAMCLLHPGSTVIWTAHRLRTADETFASMLAFSRRRKIVPFMLRPVLGSGEEEIRFRNGSRILFGARERGFGRGFAQVDVLVFDEAQILTENAIDDMVPATNQAANPLLFFTGTPPKPNDPSEVFTSKRNDALSGGSDDMAYIEFSADQDCNPLDRVQWAKANPSYPLRTNDAAMLRMKKNLTPESFVREALGVWDPTVSSTVVDMGQWARLVDLDSRIVTCRSWSVSASPDRRWASVGVAGRRVDGLLHVEWMERRPGLEWVVDVVTGLYQSARIPIRVHRSGPEGSFIGPLRERGVEVVEVSSADVAHATGQFIDACNAGELRHLGQASMDIALRGAVLRTSSDGAVLWSQRNSATEITALVACTVALGGVNEQPTVAVGGFHNLADYLED